METLGNFIAVRPAKKEELRKSEGGIILSDSLKEPFDKGELVKWSVGVEKFVTENKIPVKLGDTVLYPLGSGTAVKDGSDDLLIMSYEKLTVRL